MPEEGCALQPPPPLFLQRSCAEEAAEEGTHGQSWAWLREEERAALRTALSKAVAAQHRRLEVQTSAEAVAPSAGDYDFREPCHIMVYGLNTESPQDICYDYLCKMARRLMEENVCFLGISHDIISIRLLVTPPSSPPQAFHLDYAQEFQRVETMLVSLTKSTEENCTEILEWADEDERQLVEKVVREEAQDGQAAQSRSAGLSWKKLEALGVGPPKVRPIVTRPGDVVMMRTSSHLHRRGPALAHCGFCRLTLNIDMVPRAELAARACEPNPGAEVSRAAEVPSSDAKMASQAPFVCIDTQRSGPERLCDRAMVDDLGEQDAFLADDILQVLVQNHDRQRRARDENIEIGGTPPRKRLRPADVDCVH